jgi:hypothetical protein
MKINMNEVSELREIIRNNISDIDVRKATQKLKELAWSQVPDRTFHDTCVWFGSTPMHSERTGRKEYFHPVRFFDK